HNVRFPTVCRLTRPARASRCRLGGQESLDPVDEKRAAGETPRGPCRYRRSAKVQAEAEDWRRVVAGRTVAVGIAAGVMVAMLAPVTRLPFMRPPAIAVLIAAMVVVAEALGAGRRCGDAADGGHQGKRQNRLAQDRTKIQRPHNALLSRAMPVMGS